MELHFEQRKGSFVFTVTDGTEILGTVTAEPVGEVLLIHNTVNAWSRDRLRQYIPIWRSIRAQLRTCGFNLMATGSVVGPALAKRIKYWRLMGFERFFEVETPCGLMHCAVMEI